MPNTKIKIKENSENYLFKTINDFAQTNENPDLKIYCDMGTGTL